MEPAQTQLGHIYNPFPLTVEANVVEEVSVEAMESFQQSVRNAHLIRDFRRSEFHDYAHTIYAEIVPALLQGSYDLHLFPLRGVRQPGILTQLVLGIPNEKQAVFNYTYGTRDNRQTDIARELESIFRSKLPDAEQVSLGVLDTAKGGYGSKNLARLLRRLHDENWPQQKWLVRFHLIHERDYVPKLARLIPKHSTESVVFDSPQFHAVESLLVEDWSDGIGLHVIGGSQLKKCTTAGRIILRDDESVKLIQSDSLRDLITGMVVNPLNELMLNDPNVKHICDVWQNSGEQ